MVLETGRFKMPEPAPKMSRQEAVTLTAKYKLEEQTARQERPAEPNVVHVEVPNLDASRQSQKLEDIAPDSLLPLHQTFIALEGSTKDRKTGDIHEKFSAESNTLSITEYMNEGRGPENIQAARDYDTAHSYTEQQRKGAEYRQQQAELKAQAEKNLSILGRLGTVFELGVDASQKLNAEIDRFSDRVVEVSDRVMDLIATANARLFEAMRPAASATPEQRARLNTAKKAHQLANELELSA